MSGKEISEEEFETLRAMTGFQAEDFRRSQLGQYIFDHVDNELLQLQKDLFECDSFDGPKNQQIRNDMSIRYMFIKFVDEAMASGRIGEHNLEQMDVPDQ